MALTDPHPVAPSHCLKIDVNIIGAVKVSLAWNTFQNLSILSKLLDWNPTAGSSSSFFKRIRTCTQLLPDPPCLLSDNDNTMNCSSCLRRGPDEPLLDIRSHLELELYPILAIILPPPSNLSTLGHAYIGDGTTPSPAQSRQRPRRGRRDVALHHIVKSIDLEINCMLNCKCGIYKAEALYLQVGQNDVSFIKCNDLQ